MNGLPVFDAGHVAGSHSAHARRVLARTLKRAGAVSEAKAAPLEPRSRTEERMLKRLVHDGAIRQGRNGGYWLDEARYRELQHARWRLAAMIVLVETGVLLALFLNLPKRIH